VPDALRSRPPALAAVRALFALSLGGTLGSCSRPELQVASFGDSAPSRATPSAAAEPSDGRLTTADRMSGVLWRFRAGAPVLGAPAIGPQGSVYVGATDGSLHALSADGTFLWSYSFNGPVSGTMTVDERGIVYAATTASTLHALRPNGTPLWNARTPVAAVTGVVLGPRGDLYFGARDGALYAATRAGRTVWRMPLKDGLSMGPRSADGRRLVVASRAGELIVLEGLRQSRRFSFNAEIEAPVAVTAETVYLVAGGTLVAADFRGQQRWTAPGFANVALGRDGLIACGSDGQLSWFSTDGKVQRRARMPSAPSAAPIIDSSGRTFVPAESGSLFVFSPRGALEREVRVGRAALAEPVLDPPRSRLLVASGDGSVAAVRLAVAGAAP
jgi:outer membrane protein assembly factor BamB